jgi:hypothetical protein
LAGGAISRVKAAGALLVGGVPGGMWPGLAAVQANGRAADKCPSKHRQVRSCGRAPESPPGCLVFYRCSAYPSRRWCSKGGIVYQLPRQLLCPRRYFSMRLGLGQAQRFSSIQRSCGAGSRRSAAAGDDHREPPPKVPPQSRCERSRSCWPPAGSEATSTARSHPAPSMRLLIVLSSNPLASPDYPPRGVSESGPASEFLQEY